MEARGITPRLAYALYGSKIHRLRPFRASHAIVSWSATPLRWNPIDDLIRIGDVAGLAMHAIRSVNLQTILSLFLNHFIHGSWAEILARVAVLSTAPAIANAGVGDHEVAGLIFLMPSARVEDVSKRIECEDTVAIGSREWWRFSLKFSVFLVAGPDANWIPDAVPSGYVLER